MSQKTPNQPAARAPQRQVSESAAPPSRPRPTGRPAAPPPPPRSAARTPQRRPTRYAAPPPSGPSPSVMIAVGGAVLLAAVLAVVLLVTQPSSGSPTSTGTVPTAGIPAANTPASMAGAAVTPASGSATGVPGTPIADLTVVTGLDRGHTKDPVTYPQVPPLGGQHWDQWMNCGVYAEPVKNEQAVHSLEHGAIWITYQPSLPAAEIETLRKLTRQSGYRLLSPYPGLPHPIVASAWGYQIALDTPDDPRLYAFIANFEQNPSGPEPGASCSGSEGSPLP